MKLRLLILSIFLIGYNLNGQSIDQSLLSDNDSKTWSLSKVVIQGEEVPEADLGCMKDATLTFTTSTMLATNPCEANFRAAPVSYSTNTNTITSNGISQEVEILTSNTLVIKSQTIITESGSGLDSPVEHQAIVEYHYTYTTK